jgi:photosystem II stability/assembly factor-like uncharacterized protein
MRPRRSVRWTVAGIAIAAGGLAVLITALVRDDGASNDGIADLLAPRDPGPIHVHGLGINPTDRTLYIATHTGLWRSPPGATRSERVGESRQDTMGFTVAGRDYFLGSGHPDPRALVEQRLPPHLGLIRSTDAGQTWQPISLSGRADFHVLRAFRGRIYGFDAGNARLLVSGDAGRTWSERRSPGALIDLVVHPNDPRRLVTTSDNGSFVSSNEARSWRRLGPRIGLLAWPRPQRLYLLAANGAVFVSGDSGREWEPVGHIAGPPAAFLAASARELYAALHDGTVKRSTDGGRTWAVRATP